MPAVRSKLPCEFSEDEFQALAFAELAQRFRGVAVGGPYLEDRRAERRHGVDAWIRIRHGGRLRALFLQFKIPELVMRAQLDPSCAALYDDDPYFRFTLRKDPQDQKAGLADVYRQHNNLVALRIGTGHPAFYCAPAFIKWRHLLRTFYRGAIFEQCLLGDPFRIGYVAGSDGHHVSFSDDLSGWAFHSEPEPLGQPTPWASALDAGKLREWTAEDLVGLADEIEETLNDAEIGGPKESSPDAPGARAVMRVARVADAAYGGPVLFLPESACDPGQPSTRR